MRDSCSIPVWSLILFMICKVGHLSGADAQVQIPMLVRSQFWFILPDSNLSSSRISRNSFCGCFLQFTWVKSSLTSCGRCSSEPDVCCKTRCGLLPSHIRVGGRVWWSRHLHKSEKQPLYYVIFRHMQKGYFHSRGRVRLWSWTHLKGAYFSQSGCWGFPELVGWRRFSASVSWRAPFPQTRWGFGAHFCSAPPPPSSTSPTRAWSSEHSSEWCPASRTCCQTHKFRG